MKKGADAFRSIGEVSRLIGVAPHVLRYWETQFPQLRPMKRPDGRRYYRPDDIRLAAGLCEVLREEGLTIRGAKKLLARDRGDSIRARGSRILGESDALQPDPIGQVASSTSHSESPLLHQPDPSTDAPPPQVRPRRRKLVPPEDLPAYASNGPASWLDRLVVMSSALRQAGPGDIQSLAALVDGLRASREGCDVSHPTISE